MQMDLSTELQTVMRRVCFAKVVTGQQLLCICNRSPKFEGQSSFMSSTNYDTFTGIVGGACASAPVESAPPGWETQKEKEDIM